MYVYVCMYVCVYLYRCQTAEEVADFIFGPSGLLCCLRCDHTQVHVAIAINVLDLIDADKDLALVKAVSCFYPRLDHALPECNLTPGDYPVHDYHQSFLHQFPGHLRMSQ